MDRTERFYKIKELLRLHRVVSFATLQAELEVSRSTLKRDMAYFSTRLNNPIEWSREAGGYLLLQSAGAVDKPHELPGLWFSSTEIHALLTMQHLLAHWRGRSVRIAGKLGLRSRVLWLHGRVVGFARVSY